MDTCKIGQFIAENRKKQNMTQVQLAEKLGVTGKTVSRWENGNYMPDLSLLQPLAKELNITLNELLRGEYIDTEHLLEKSEQNLKDTVDYSHSKIQKKQNVIKILVAVCMVIMVAFGYWVTQENYHKYGYYDTVEECRNEFLDTWGYVHGKDSVYWRDEMFKGRWYQVCMYITDDKCAIFLIEKINGKYQVTDRSSNSQYLKKEDDDYIPMHEHMGYSHPKPFTPVYIHWDAVPGNKEIKFRDQTIEPLANVKGYTLWYRITDYWPDYAEITVTEKEN